jgi:hypothetical protein
MSPRPTPELQREYQREWVAARRHAFFADKTCATCGATEDLHLHHRDRASKVAHAIWSWREERRLEEIAKCDVLCRSCHEALHAVQRERHGTESRYKRGCRCGLCRWAKAQSTARYHARKRVTA